MKSEAAPFEKGDSIVVIFDLFVRVSDVIEASQSRRSKTKATRRIDLVSFVLW